MIICEFTGFCKVQTAEQKRSKLPNETLKYLDIVAVNRYAYPRVDGVLVVPIGCLKN